MTITPSDDSLALKSLIDQINENKIRINREYQRSGKIWPGRAKSFLVETVLRDMPIPRVLLHKVASPTPPHERDIIDGQQRCTILKEYREDGFALTADVDDENLHGKRFSDLTPRQQKIFDAYVVSIDEYDQVTPKEIREVFKRLNYYTAPLNAAEQRHAQFYGELSRFVEEQSEAWRPLLAKLRVFTKRQLRRKADEQLMAEIVDAMLNGVSTTTAKSLRKVYQDHELQFASAQDFGRKLDRARSRVAEWEDLKGRKLMKHYQIFSLVIALIHAESNLKAVRRYLGPSRPLRSRERVLRAFQPLDRAVQMKVQRGRYASFWTASHEQTNVRENRLRRCKYFYEALTGVQRRA